MKRFFALFALIMLAVTPLCLVGCKSKYDNLAIEMEENFSIVLGQDENDSITVQARVTGASDDNGGRLSFSPDNDRLVKISQEYKNGINYITLKALAPGRVNIEARTLEGGVTKNFVVNIIQPIKNFTVKNENFVVVRGGEWKIDVEKNLNLEPTNTTQTDFVVAFAANQDIDGLSIENNVLLVSENSKQEEIVLSVTSLLNEEIAPKEIKLTVLDDFVEIDKQTQANQSRFEAGDILVFEKNESMLTYDKLEEINIMSNLLSESEREIVVRVYATKKVDVNAVENSRLSVKKISTLETLDAGGNLQYTDFVFAVRFADIVSSGTTTNLDFVARYANFDFSKQLTSIKVAYELAPKTLLVNDQDDLSEFTLYNFYSTAKKGQKLQFGVLPTSVSSENSKMMLLNKNNLVNAFDYIQFFRSNGEELFEGDQISANEIIYARAKGGVNTGSYEIVLQTKFVNFQTNAPLSKILKFDVLAGITNMNFENEEQINLQLNSTQNFANVVVCVGPANVDVTKIHVEDVDGLNFSSMTNFAQTTDGISLKFVVRAEKVGNYKIKVYSENGIEITKDVKVVCALEDVVLSAPSPNDNSVVGDRQIIGGELRYVAVSLGGGIALEQTILPVEANYRVEYSYFEAETMPEFALSTYDYPNTVSSTSVGILDYSQLLGYGKIVALKDGYSVVRAKYVPLGIVDNVETELEPIYKFFVVQGYRPIRSVVMSSNYEKLYSLKSVGAYNKHLTMTKVSLSVFPTDATYADSIVWTYDNSGEYFDFDEETLSISAKKRYAGTISIIATIRELNRTYTQTLSVTIVDAKTVSDISVNGIGDSIYIENTDDTDKTVSINAIAFPNDAFNTKLRYNFVDQAGNIISDIKISDNGIMTIPAGIGLNGYVRVAAEDCFQENTSTGEYEPVGVEGKNIIMIPTIIANGTSKETAIRITTKEELQNIDTKKHYKIYNDLDVSEISFENFSGGLYGANSESRIVLGGIDRTFIQTLAKTGRIEDLEISCDVSLLGDNGVLIGKNEGYVNNLVVGGNWSGALSLVKNNAGRIYNVTSEVVFDGEKLAGIAGVNSGEIYGCKFMGSITASNQAAGIVLSNRGLVDNCATLLIETSVVKLSETFDAQARVAGVCVENLESGRILRSYIHSYKNDSAFSSSDTLYVCGFVHSNNGTIQKCFSALNDIDSVTGFVYLNNANAKIENCYSNTTFAAFNNGTIKNCFSVLDDERLNAATDCYSGANATEKTVSDWLKTNWDISSTYAQTTIWKIYLDSQNPFLREVSAEVKPESMIVSVKEPKSTNSYIKLSDNQVVLYRYESLVSPLTVAEKAKLNTLNSISIYDLLTFEIMPYSASSSPDMFNYTLSEGGALEISGLNIVVLGLGKQTLTITSKLNPELTYTLDIYSSYPIRDFNVFASASSLDPSNALINETTIYLKRSYTQPLYSKVSKSIILVDREIAYKTYDLKMNYSNSDELIALGLFVLTFEESQNIDDFTCALDFTNATPYSEFDEIKATLPSFFARIFKVVVYNGAESLLASQYSFEMEPIDSIKLEINLTTDLFGGNEELTDEKLSDILGEIFKDSDSKQIIRYEIYSSTGVNLTDEYFHFDYEVADFDKNADSKGFRTFKILLDLRLRQKTSQISGDYYIRVYANEVENTAFSLSPIDISLKLLPQSIQRIDYSHYYAESEIQEQQEVLKANTSPSNALAPGQVGLLEINLFPTYSEISHVEIESIPNQDHTVKLQLYQRKDVNNLSEFVMVQQNADYNRTENGIMVGYTMITNGTIYVKTQVASSIPEELTFELVVRAYKTKDDQNPVSQHVFLVAKFIPSATVEIDGQKDYAVMGRGTSKEMTITVVGEGDVEVYVDNGGNGVYSYQLAYVGQKTLKEQRDLGSQNQYVWACPLYVGSQFENDKSDVVTIRVVVSREVNGVREKKTTTLTVRVLDFVVNKVVLTNGTDKYSSKVSVKTKFDFSFDISEPQAFTNDSEDIKAVEGLKQKIENFKNAQYFTGFGDEGGAYIYEKSFMYVDTAGEHSFAIKNDDGYVFDQNEFVEFGDVFAEDETTYSYTTVTGLKTGTQKMKLKVSALSNNQENAEIYSITYDFDIVVTNYSNEDKPMPVGSLDDFNAIFEQADAQDYILTNDIEISDHVIHSDTSKIRSLDGNNHKIIIKSLNLGTNQSLDVALFNTISETTTIKNLIVDYQIGEINANSDQFSSMSIAGLALDNAGIVTNTHVLSSKGASTQTTGGLQVSSSVGQSTQIQMAGFVLNNSGSITNSRVGDTSVTIVDTQGRTQEQSLKVFALVGQDQMAGFVLNNSGIISASYAKNITITNNSKFQSGNQTAGFVLNNQSNAKITGSYVRGVESLNKSGVYVLGEGIESSFEVAGFVFDNFSYISDCYSNIKLYKETPMENRAGIRSAGFVYKNEVGAQIVSSLSLCKIIEDDTSQQHFCGVDGENQSNNKGTITYSYYYSQEGRLQSVADGAELLDAAAVKQEDHYYGYVFTTLGALDGMWFMTSRGPDLVSANNIALSKRYLISTEEDKFDVAYVANYEYGSIYNPILIRSATEFNEVFGTSKDDSIKKYFDVNKKQAFGNYRIINDIDLSDLSLGGEETSTLSSTSFTLMRKTDEFGAVIGHGMLEGNSMTISNLDFSITDTTQTCFGLFASIKNGAVVKNINLTVKEISASSVNYVGALAGFVEDSKVINVSAQIAQGQQVALVQGRNIVGGIVGAVSGTSELNNISSSISAHATFVDSTEKNDINNNSNGTASTDDDVCVQAAVPKLPSEGASLNPIVSIAGSVAGAVYTKDIYDSTNNNLSTITHAQVQKIKASGKISVSAKIVGGLVGYVGKTTYIHDAWFSIEEGQSLIAHDHGVAGGAVGVGYGKISHVRIEHNDVQDYSDSAESIQTEIESNVEAYYTGKSNERKTYENMFASTFKGQTLGGIVGVMNGGMLEDSYTKLDVISDTAYNLGGIVGIVKNQTYSISRVYTFSNVQSKSTEKNVLVGGLFGALLSFGELNTVVGANYLDKNYTTAESAKEKYVAFAPFAGAVTYSPKMTNVYVLSGIWTSGTGGIDNNKGANVTSAKIVSTLTTTLGSLFPASKHAIDVNEVFEIEDSHFKNTFWARNVDDVLPHLTFGLEEQYYIIDSFETANDIRKMLKNSNKTFYIDGRVDLNNYDVRLAIKEVRESIIFTGKLLGITADIKPIADDAEDPTLVGLQELFSSAIGATFAGFNIESPNDASSTIPTNHYGIVAGQAKDCSFRDINIEGNSASLQSNSSSPETTGTLVGLAEGKTSFEKVSIKDITIISGTEKYVGLFAGQTKTSAATIFRDCSIIDCSIEVGSASTNKSVSVGGFVGYAQHGATITSNTEAKVDGIKIVAKAQYVGGLVGQSGSHLNISNMNISKIKIADTYNDDAYVGGLVGYANNLTITLNSEIVLTNPEDASSDYGTISLNNTGNAYLGGIAGKVQNTLSISHATNGGSADLKTNNMKVQGSSVYAGGVVGRVGQAATINNLCVNTQGEIKNKALKIVCAGDIYAGGLVGEAQNVKISECWSGTDVEISGVNTSSQVWFGGIVGEVTEADSNTDISSNVSCGRFFLDSDVNINTINAGGIVGTITKSKTASNVSPIKGNKTLTSLEIRRQATNHNVNAVAGSRTNVTGGNNAYTYQLSLAVESDTNFATNCSTLEGVGVSSSTAKEGSILNPIKISNDATIEDGKYYSIETAHETAQVVTLTFPTEECDFVLIGNGGTIANTHFDKVGSRTILSGFTAGSFSVTNLTTSSSVTIDGKIYTYANNQLTTGATTIGLQQGVFDSLTEDAISYGEENKPYHYVVFGENIRTNIENIYNENNEENIYLIENEYYSFQNEKANLRKIDSFTSQVVIDANIYKILEDTNDGGDVRTYLQDENNAEYNFVSSTDNSALMIVKIDETDYYYTGSGMFYIENDEQKPIEISEIPNYGQQYSVEYETSNKVNVATIDGQKYELGKIDDTIKSISINSTSYRVDKGNKKLYKQVNYWYAEINSKKYVKSGNFFIDTSNASIQHLISTSSTFASDYHFIAKDGFIKNNNGYVSGVVIFANYQSSSDKVGGFVGVNNGVVLYSSFNGHVYNSNSDGIVAGFVAENNGIIDYCYSTGAVQGTVDISYSFGNNKLDGTKKGAIKNSYTISLNESDSETADKKNVFGNEVEDSTFFEGNEYDPVATEIDRSSGHITKLSNSLIPYFGDAKTYGDSLWRAKGWTKNKEIYNYGYKTLCALAFSNIGHLTPNTGTGKESNPYQIANARLLTKINTFGINKCYYSLINNINVQALLSSTDNNDKEYANNWTSIAMASDVQSISSKTSFSSLFSGVFAGNNKIIRGINQTIHEDNSTRNFTFGGMFGGVSGEITDLILQNVNINVLVGKKDSNNAMGGTNCVYVGGLAGYVQGEAAISNVKIINSTIEGSATGIAGVGGLLGYVNSAKEIIKCSSESSVSIKANNIFNSSIGVGAQSSTWIGFDSKSNGHYAYAGGIIGESLIEIDKTNSSYANVNSSVMPLEKWNKNSDVANFIAPKNFVVDKVQNKYKGNKVILGTNSTKNGDYVKYRYSAQQTSETLIGKDFKNSASLSSHYIKYWYKDGEKIEANGYEEFEPLDGVWWFTGHCSLRILGVEEDEWIGEYTVTTSLEVAVGKYTFAMIALGFKQFIAKASEDVMIAYIGKVDYWGGLDFKALKNGGHMLFLDHKYLDYEIKAV